jgi:hypothetical protein
MSVPLRVRYYANLQPTGYGFSALEYALGLQRRMDVELDLRPIGGRPEIAGGVHGRLEELVAALDHQIDEPDVVLVHTLPRDCGTVLAIEGIDHHKVPCVAYTTWEAMEMPVELGQSLHPFCRVLTPSIRSAVAISNAINQSTPTYSATVSVVPHGYDPKMVNEYLGAAADWRKGRAEDGKFAFYYVGAMNRRKNVEGLVRAFAHAFGGAPEVRLVLHCAGANPIDLAMMVAGTGIDNLPVQLENTFCSTTDIWALHAVGDCYVTASRGEAWGLGSFEAMVSGRHVIAPHGQGSDAYLADTSAHRYRTGRQPAGMHTSAERTAGGVKISAAGPTLLSSRQTWWEPDLMDLAAAMRSTYQYKINTITFDQPDHLARFTQERVTQDLVTELQGAI